MHWLYFIKSLVFDCSENSTLTILELYQLFKWIQLLEPIKECTSQALFLLASRVNTKQQQNLIFGVSVFLLCLFPWLLFSLLFLVLGYVWFWFWFAHSQCVISHNRRIETYSFSDMTGQRIRHISFLACRKISLASTGEKKSPLRSRSVSIFCVSFNL